MKNKVIKQLFSEFEKEIHKHTISEVTELYGQFNTECERFRKTLTKLAGKEQSPKISEEIDRIVRACTTCFFELAYAYFDKGYCNGLCFATEYFNSK